MNVFTAAGTTLMDDQLKSEVSTPKLSEFGTGVNNGVGLYQGNSVFRNQPSYNVFSKSFVFTHDALYSYLNDVDSDILKNEQAEPTDIFISYERCLTLKDPRTREPINQTVRDYTSAGMKTSTFRFPNIQNRERYSTLNREQQAACLRVLLARQYFHAIPEDDFSIWKATENKRCAENQVVQKYIYDYSLEQKEMIYKPMRSLVNAYQKWFQSRIEHVLKNRPINEMWVTHTGLPQVSQCRSLELNDQDEVTLEKVHLKKIEGDLRYWPHEIKLEREQLKSLNIRMERYATATETHEYSPLMDENWDGGHLFYLPLESLLMLMTPSAAYADLPTEMFINIKETGELKRIVFNTPLPAHHCGWHTNSFILTLAYESFISQPGQSQWIHVGKMTKENTKESNTYPGDYKVFEIDLDCSSKEPTKTNRALISWCLSGSPNSSIQIHTQMSISGSRDNQAKRLLGCHHLKLESKPECGLEIMTKYELLKIWLQLRLLKTDRGHCSRLALINLEPLLEEEFTLSSIEQQLYEHYNTNVRQLLANLYEFLKLFIGLSPDEYLIRYTPKYKDKFLLCRKTQESTPQSFSLKELLKRDSSLPLEHCFLIQSNSCLPISKTLCGSLHLDNQMLPCTFPSKYDGKDVRIRTTTKSETTTKLKTTATKRRSASLLRRKQHKFQQKKRSRARKRDADKKEMEEQMQLDKIMYL